ncbi:hypothetical protein C0J45_2358 [Silurus meridionalis]|nr:hypothetical protein C0J45_2358 [Silurus meridionalis]
MYGPGGLPYRPPCCVTWVRVAAAGGEMIHLNPKISSNIQQTGFFCSQTMKERRNTRTALEHRGKRALLSLCGGLEQMLGAGSVDMNSEEEHDLESCSTVHGNSSVSESNRNHDTLRCTHLQSLKKTTNPTFQQQRSEFLVEKNEMQLERRRQGSRGQFVSGLQ